MTIPVLEGFETYYGIAVCSVGEDGDLLALGHHEPLHVIAAMNAYSRKVIGLMNMCDDPRMPNAVAVIAPNLRWMWAQQRTLADCEYRAEADKCDCEMCEELRHGGWWLQWSDEQADGAFPVTVWKEP